jgi:DNA-directed RNA polymerase specialized sigma24 family protein
MEQNKRQMLENADWGELTLKLMSYAVRRVRSIWRTGHKGLLPKGSSCEDLVQEAIQKAFDESRKWNPERVDLFQFLKWTVRSRISHLYDSYENRKNVAEPNGYSGRAASRPVEAAVLGIEYHEVMEQFHFEMLRKAQGNPDLEKVIDCLRHDLCTPQEVSQATGIPIGKVYQLRYRLIEIAKSVKQQPPFADYWSPLWKKTRAS